MTILYFCLLITGHSEAQWPSKESIRRDPIHCWLLPSIIIIIAPIVTLIIISSSSLTYGTHTHHHPLTPSVRPSVRPWESAIRST